MTPLRAHDSAALRGSTITASQPVPSRLRSNAGFTIIVAALHPQILEVTARFCAVPAATGAPLPAR
jgi:hypothetical protein